jgi:hypothetical protein
VRGVILNLRALTSNKLLRQAWFSTFKVCVTSWNALNEAIFLGLLVSKVSLKKTILYIKATVVSICLCGQCLGDSSNHCPFPVELVTIKATVVVYVCLCGQCMEDSSSHCSFPVELVYVDGGEGPSGGGPARARGGGTGEGEFDGCIMH